MGNNYQVLTEQGEENMNSGFFLNEQDQKTLAKEMANSNNSNSPERDKNDKN